MSKQEDSDDALLDNVGTEQDNSLLNNSHNTKENQEKSIMEKSEKKNCLSYFTIEPFLLLFMTAYTSKTTCSQSFLMDKACINIFNFSANVCSNLDNYTKEKSEVEVYANNYNLYINLIQTAPGVLFSLVIAPWSDKYGRKLPIFIAVIGQALQNVGIIFNVIYFDAPLYYMLVSAIPYGLVGGMTVVLMSVYSLVSEQSSRKKRTVKYAFLELALGLGLPIGTFLSGFIYKQCGYLYVYIMSLSLQLMAAIWLILFVKETRSVKKLLTCKILTDLFCFDNFKKSVHTITRKRENNLRLEILLLIASMSTLIVSYISTSEFAYTFVRWMYSWDVTTFSNVHTVFIVIAMVGTGILVPILIKVIKVSDAFLGTLGSISMFLSNVIKGFAYKSWLYYLSGAVACFSPICMLAVRSRLSKIVPGDELGEVFAFLSSCESLVPFLGSVMLIQIFNATINTIPGLVYLCCGFMIILPLIVFPWISYRKKFEYTLLHNKAEDPPTIKNQA